MRLQVEPSNRSEVRRIVHLHDDAGRMIYLADFNFEAEQWRATLRSDYPYSANELWMLYRELLALRGEDELLRQLQQERQRGNKD